MDLNKHPIARSGKKQIFYKDLPYKGEDITPLPYLQNDDMRFAAFISAPSGAGKSYEAARLIKELLKMKKYKKNMPVLVTLSQDEDPAYEGIEYFKMPLNDLLDETIDISFFRDTIMVFDDWESGEKETVKFIHSLIKRVLERGRKQNIAVIVICHQTQNYGLTRDIIFECDTYVLYPIGGINSVLRFAKSYMDLDAKEIKRLQADVQDLRSFHFHKSIPRYLATENMIRKI